jgi:biopolymer transport protein ExbD
MQLAGLNLGESGSDQLFARRSEHETPEFDITAMVDLVFMMNIYFLVTFITVALGELNLPSADHVSALDAETATVFTLTRSPDGKGVTLFVGSGEEGEPLREAEDQERAIQTAIEQGLAEGKKDVVLKAERKVRLGELFRIATAATLEGTKLHVAVLEKDAAQ